MTSHFSEHLVCLFPGQGSLSSGAGLKWQESKHWEQTTVISEASGIDVASLLTTAKLFEPTMHRLQLSHFRLLAT